MIWFGTQLADVFEEGVFPLPMGGVQYADRKTFLYDVVRENMERVAGLRGTVKIQPDHPLECSLDPSRRGSHTHFPRDHTFL